MLTYFLYLIFSNKIDEKKFFNSCYFFSFLTKFNYSVLHGAGFNHLMTFMFFLSFLIGLINFQIIKRFYILISIFLIISSFLNYYQLINYNLLGRQGLYFNEVEKNEIINLKIHS